jgi:hypothetical protein
MKSSKLWVCGLTLAGLCFLFMAGPEGHICQEDLLGAAPGDSEY